MVFTEEQIASLAPAPTAFNAGKKLAAINNWQRYGRSSRALWGEIKGSAKKPYLTQIDTSSIAYKCSCPSRQFPCKHSIALMLLYSQQKDSFNDSVDEPEWVVTWLDKRQKTAEIKDTIKEVKPEDLKRKEQNKQKTQANRLVSVMAGANELELWLKDLIRIGLLELPNKPKSEFKKVAARMVDAKASGLANLVKSIGQLNYQQTDQWQTKALEIISKTFLLIRSIQNYHELSPIWQTTIKSLTGWGQSTKELSADPNAQVINDHWVVLGQETEQVDDIITERNWLLGGKTNTTALILNFGTPYSTLESNLLPGTTIDAELAFFPSIQPLRAIIKEQKNISNDLTSTIIFHDSWDQIKKATADILQNHPWANDHIFTLKNAVMMQYHDKWVVSDSHEMYLPVADNYDYTNILKFLASSGNAPRDIALIIRDNEVLPLGIFEQNQYKVF